METLQSHLTRACTLLEHSGVESPRLDAEILCCRALGVDREALWRDPDRMLSKNEIAQCEAFIVRRQAREPLAYIIGEREFWSLTFKVTPDVLIPRPESELLIETLLAKLSSKKDNVDVYGLDLCTGSGALAISIAHEIQNCSLLATDLSPAALEIARENSLRHQVNDRLTFLLSDLYRNFENSGYKHAMFDFIVCNPPYIRSDNCEQLQPEVSRFEPRHALDGGAEGTDFYPRIIEGSTLWLKPEGHLLMEIGCEQGSAIQSRINTCGGFGNCEILRDHSGRDRLVSAQRLQ